MKIALYAFKKDVKRSFYEVNVLGHGTLGHDFSSVELPRCEQFLPPNDGAGLLQARIRDVKPLLPQVTGQKDQAVHSL